MAVVKMNKLSLIGLESEKRNILKLLMRIGVVEISMHNNKEEVLDLGLSEKISQEKLSKLTMDVDKLESAIEHLKKFDDRKKPLISSKTDISYEEFENRISKKDDIWEVVNEINKIDDELNSLKSRQNKIDGRISNLNPWKSFDIPAEISETQRTKLILGTIPAIVNIEEIKNEIKENYERYVFEVISSDTEQYYAYLISYDEDFEDILSTIKHHGFSKVDFNDFTYTVEEKISELENEKSQLEERKSMLNLKIESLKDSIEDIEILYDVTLIEMDEEKGLENILSTQSAFIFEGWIPEKYVGVFQKKIDEKFQVHYEISQIEEDEENIPILLENDGFSQSGEALTEMYSLPNYKEADPNFFVTLFFSLFFGLMLSDAGYGLLLIGMSSLVLWKFKLGNSMKNYMKIVLYCGISTLFWGAMFGGWFGDILSNFGVKPLWFDPISNPQRLLKFALLFGVIHLYIGFGIKAYNLIKNKKYLDAVLDVGLWYVFLTGAIMALADYIPDIGNADLTDIKSLGTKLFLGGAILLVLTQGRKKKGIIMKFLSGLLSLYDLVGFMGDTLSYARLLALGLATGVIAKIINQIGSMGGKTIGGIIGFIVIFIVGHVVNFMINALGAYVHSIRLHYIEFFGKFYEGGGRAFKPLNIKTKYINIINK